MADGRKRSAAKQARRDARRRKAQHGRAAQELTPEDVPLIDEVREALDGGHPLDLLGLVSMLILATSSRPALRQPPDGDDTPSLEELVAAFIDVRVPETTALLIVLGELIVDDDVLSDRCRREVDSREDRLPHWLVALAQTSVHAVVRMSHVLGDGDEILLGVRLADGQELTCAVNVDHLTTSEIRDAFFVPTTLDEVLGIAKKSNDDPDTSFVDVEMTEARGRLQDALARHLTLYPLEESDTWPGSRALVQWLVGLMPIDGSSVYVPPDFSSLSEQVLTRFFASLVATRFSDTDHREVLLSCIELGTGDPLRWSALRLRQLLSAPMTHPDDISAELQLDVPELLRAFVPFAHAESGIRHELTVDALAVIDEEAENYRDLVFEEAQQEGLVDDDLGTI